MRWLRDRLDWVPGAHRPRPARAGLAGLAALSLLLIVAFGGWRPWAGSGRLVRAQFASADQLVRGRTPVRVAGVQVGTVDAVESGPGGHGSTVVMKLTDDAMRVSRDASANIRLRTVLGGTRYIDLEPGSPSAAALGAGLIPLSRTGVQVDWDDVTQIFGADTRNAQRTVLRGLRQGLADPAGAGRTIDALGPDLAIVGHGLGPLRGEQAGELPRLINATGAVLDALSSDQRALQQLVAGGERTLGVTDAHRRALGEALTLTPPALDATTATMTTLNATLDRLDPLARDLRPGARALDPAARALRPALDATNRLLRSAQPLLHDLPPALRDLAAASRQGVPLIGALNPTVGRLRSSLLPWLRSRDADTHLRNYEAIGPLFSVLDSAAGDFDANGWFFHFPITPTGDTLLLPCGPALTPGQLNRCDALNGVLRKTIGGHR
ncbi:MAG: phospholipid/cholesterol/gamma-HCH transport system substrate-binding protein [Thermoleophilaceae bacterium]|nr:phospholipid/cholesterol/gamma-HCH transport system substrate-binding protein [Thermoleophilaceae bacterium]